MSAILEPAFPSVDSGNMVIGDAMHLCVLKLAKLLMLQYVQLYQLALTNDNERDNDELSDII